MDGGEGLSDRPRADPGAVGENQSARAGHRVHPAAPVPGADLGDLEAALEKYTKDGKIQGLILDLRNNPGGLLTSSVEVTEKFIDSGRLVVYTEGRVRNQNMRFQANSKRVYSDFPMVVLINQGSASASEIVAGPSSRTGGGRW